MRKDWSFETLRAFAIETTIRSTTKHPAVAGSHAPTSRGPARPEGQFKPARERRRPALGHLVIRHYTVA